MNINDKLYRTRYNIDIENPHIWVDSEQCKRCNSKACLNICPAEVYKLEREEIVVSWQDCMECGSCRIVCPLGAVQWDFPRGGFGVCYRYG